MLCKGYQACSQVCAEELVEDCGIADSRTRDDGLKFALNDAASRLQQVKVKSKAAVVTVLISGTPEPFPGDEAAQKVLEAQRAALQRTGFVMVCPAGAQRRTILDTGFWASFQRLPEGADTKGLSLSSLSLSTLQKGLKERWPVRRVARGATTLLHLTPSVALPLKVSCQLHSVSDSVGV
jgi:hypothetical protein